MCVLCIYLFVVCVSTFSTDSEGNWDFDLVTSTNLTASAISIDPDRYVLRTCNFSASITN